MLERAGAVAGHVGQCHPELDAVQRLGAGRRDLGVDDAAAARHEVDLAGADDGVRTTRIMVFDGALEQPRDRLQPGVGVRRHVHAAAAFRAVVVDEAPRPDERAVAVRQGASHLEGTQPAERNLAG